MNVSEDGVALVKRFEGLRLDAYRDSVGVLTVGYGHTGPDVLEGMTITEERADELLRKDLLVAEACVNRHCKDLGITQGMFDALCSFVFNLGCGAFGRSTLLKRLLAGDDDGAAAEFDKWVLAGGQKLAGLVKRRAAERELFESVA